MNQVKKGVIHLMLIGLAYLCYFLQANFFSWFTIAGIAPNIFIIFILFVGLFGSKTMGIVYGIVMGAILDVLFGSKIGIYAGTLGLIGFLATIFDRNFSKDSRMTMMLMIMGSTILLEVIVYLLNYAIQGINIEILPFIKILGLEVIFNLLLTIILYPLMQRFGYYIENQCKGNQILTRYF